MLQESFLNEYAVIKCQNQVYILDYLDRYPLCIAVMNKKISKQVIRQLISIFPEAAKQFDKMQRLPLHYVILSCREYNECINDLVGAALFALSSIDPITGLYPFMMSASNQSSLIYSNNSRLVKNPLSGKEHHFLETSYLEKYFHNRQI